MGDKFAEKSKNRERGDVDRNDAGLILLTRAGRGRGAEMEVDTCVKQMIRGSGHSLGGVSKALGRSKVWATTIGREGRSPSLAAVAMVAEAVGYRLAVIDAEENVVDVIHAPSADKKRVYYPPAEQGPDRLESGSEGDIDTGE